MKDPLVTVLINNYNYAEFIAAAIESALAQTYRPLEVVVVDDGSLDASRNVISKYDGEIVSIYKENGGQASAFNMGFNESTGDIVRFLDADDILISTSVETVVEAFSRHPSAGMIQCRVEVADAKGDPLGIFIPPAYVRMPTGDLRGRPADVSNTSWWTPTSGISVSSAVLVRVLPLPENLYRISADLGLALASALSAPVVSLDAIGAYYRSHGRNFYNRGKLDSKRIREDLRHGSERQRHLHQFAQQAGVEGYPESPDATLDTVFLIKRLLAAKLGSAGDRLEGDTPLSVARQGARVAFRRPDVGPIMKIALVFWFALIAVLPRSMARRLAEKTLFQQNRRRLSRAFATASEALGLRKQSQQQRIAP
jgi:hypothetical protein